MADHEALRDHVRGSFQIGCAKYFSNGIPLPHDQNRHLLSYNRNEIGNVGFIQMADHFKRLFFEHNRPLALCLPFPRSKPKLSTLAVDQFDDALRSMNSLIMSASIRMYRSPPDSMVSKPAPRLFLQSAMMSELARLQSTSGTCLTKCSRDTT